jgi:hypothetical protein
MTATRAELARLISELRKTGYLIPRTARKPHRCICADTERKSGRPNPEYRPGCAGDINPGDAYVEYVGEAGFAESGHPYCAPCGHAVWLEAQ